MSVTAIYFDPERARMSPKNDWVVVVEIPHGFQRYRFDTSSEARTFADAHDLQHSMLTQATAGPDSRTQPNQPKGSPGMTQKYGVTKKAPWHVLCDGEIVGAAHSTRTAARTTAQTLAAAATQPLVPDWEDPEPTRVSNVRVLSAEESAAASSTAIDVPATPTPQPETPAAPLDPNPEPTKEKSDMRVKFQMPGKVYLVLHGSDPTITVQIKFTKPQLDLIDKGVRSDRPKGLVVKYDLTEKQADTLQGIIVDTIDTIRKAKNAATKSFHKQNTLRYMANTVDRISEAIDEARDDATAAA